MLSTDEAKACQQIIRLLAPMMVDLGDAYTEIADIVGSINPDNSFDMAITSCVRHLYVEMSDAITQIQAIQRSVGYTKMTSPNAATMAEALKELIDEIR